MNAALFARVDALMARRRRARPDRRAGPCADLYHRMFVAPAPARRAERDRLEGDRAAARQRSGPRSARTCWPTRGPGSCRSRPDGPRGLPQIWSPRARRPRPIAGGDGHVRDALAQPDRAVPAVLAAARPARERRSAPGRRAARTAARPTTARSSPRCWRCARSGRGCSATRTSPPSSSSREMAKTPEAVRDLLMAVWAPARARAEADAARLEELMRADGVNGAARALGLALLRRDPRRRASTTSTRPRSSPTCSSTTCSPRPSTSPAGCSGSSFDPIEAALYHPDARAWEVRRGERHVGVFIGDFFARPSKRSGAWCTSFRSQRKLDGEVRPIAVNVCNFAKAPDGRAEPAHLRRRAHAVSRDGARAARAAVGRDLRVRLGHLGRARLRGAAEPALRALARDAGGAEAHARHADDRARRCRAT